MPRRKAEIAKRDEWGLHRRELYLLFIVEEKPVREICAHMREQRNFDKKEKDYEYRFKKWNFRRNLHYKELRFILDQVSRREEDDRRSEVVISGMTWPMSKLRGRVDRHRLPPLSMAETPLPAPTEFLARVQTPSPMLSDLPEYPRALPWIQFNSQVYQARGWFDSREALMSIPMRIEGQEPVFAILARLFPSDPLYLPALRHLVQPYSPNSPRKIRAILEAICPQVHNGDHETTAEILHTSNQESVLIELVRLVMYLATNNMISELGTVLGCDVDLSKAENMMDFLRGAGLLTKMNIEILVRTPGPTTEAFLNLLLQHSMFDDKNCDVLEWMTDSGFDVDHHIFFNYNSPVGSLGRSSFVCIIRIWCRQLGAVTLLQAAILAGNMRAVRILLDAGADMDQLVHQSDPFPLECAAALASHNHALEVVELLMSKTATPLPFSRERGPDGAFCLAIANANTRLMRRLLRADWHCMAPAIRPEHFSIAAKYADCATIHELVEHSVTGTEGKTVLPKDILFSALRHNRSRLDLDLILRILEDLLRLGADPKQVGCSGCQQDFVLVEACDLLDSGCQMLGPTPEAEDAVAAIIKLLIAHGSPVERPRTAGYGWMPSAVQFAIEYGSSRVVELLLDEGAETDYQSDPHKTWSHVGHCPSQYCLTREVRGSSPLSTAISNGRLEIAKMLLRRTPTLQLHVDEIQWKHAPDLDVELTAMLLQGGIDLDREELLKVAIGTRDPKVINLFLSTNTDGWNGIDPAIVLEAALIAGNHEAISAAIAVCDYSSGALCEAVVQSRRTRDHSTVNRLLKIRKPAPNDDFEIHTVASAFINGDLGLLRTLVAQLEAGPWAAPFSSTRRPDYGVGLPFFTHKDEDASRSFTHMDEDGIYRLLAPDYANCTDPQHVLQVAAEFAAAHTGTLTVKALTDLIISAEMLAIDCRDLTTETVKILLAAGAGPNPQESPYKNSPLETAIEASCESTVKVLLDADAVVSRSPLQLAIQSGQPKIIEMLLDRGADINAPAGYYHGATCLQISAAQGNIGVARLLLHRGAEVWNAKRSMINGRTAIEAAAENGRLDMLKLLLLQHQDPIQTADQRYQFIRAAKFAHGQGNYTVAQMVEKHIAWGHEDQRLFDEVNPMQQVFVDEMTQKPSPSERQSPGFHSMVKRKARESGFKNAYDIKGIEEWIGGYEKHGRDNWNDCWWESTSEEDVSTCSEGNEDWDGNTSEGNVNMRFEGVNPGQPPEARYDASGQPCDLGFRATQQQFGEQQVQRMPLAHQPDLKRSHDGGIHNSDMPLHAGDDVADAQAQGGRAWGLGDAAGPSDGAQLLAPAAIHRNNTAPWWPTSYSGSGLWEHTDQDFDFEAWLNMSPGEGDIAGLGDAAPLLGNGEHTEQDFDLETYLRNSYREI